MDEAVHRGFSLSSNKGPEEEDATRTPTSGIRASSALSHPHILKTSFSNIALVVWVLSTTYLGIISGQAVTQNFNVNATSYECGSNIICLGQAHRYEGDESSLDISPGMLSLLNSSNPPNAGISYYKERVKLLEPSSQQAASFSCNFTVYVRKGWNANQGMPGDGMTFVISANNSYLGGGGGNFGIFAPGNYSTPFKSIVVELDTWENDFIPIDDINGNHVSFDFSNITAVAVADASEVNVTLSDGTTKYVWVEYSELTQQLEVRVASSNSTRPMSPLLNYTMNLYDHAEEFMWVGFSSGSGSSYSNFYIGDWTFASSGIPPPPPPAPPTPIPPDPPLPAPAPAPVPGQTGAKSNGSKVGTAVTSKRKVGIAVGSALGFLAFILVCVVVVSLTVRSRSGDNREQEEDFILPIEGMPERFTYKQLSLATRAFTDDSKLGQGGFGSVHRGVLPESGAKVAIKKINSDSKQGEKEFMAEVSIISQLRHRNLILLQGWCKNTAKKQYLLVYELMSNGSLDKVLFGSPGSGTFCLSWAHRFNIVTGVAAALEYLHQGWKQQVIHRDIKSSNIMLDDDWNAKLGDFGLARLVDHQKVSTTTVVAGTYGYIAPEAAVSGKFTDKTDVFAFGAVVLEIACGRKASAADLPPEEVILVDWVWDRLSKGALLSTVDKRLGDYDKNCMEKVLMVGLLCSHPNPLARPSMRHVVQVLAGDVPVPSIPASKPVPFGYEEYWHRFWSNFSLSSESDWRDLLSASTSDSTQGVHLT